MFGSHVLPDRSLVLRCHYQDTDQAYVAGTFSDWEPLPLEPSGDGWWQLVVGPVPDGDYRYKFVADGHWFLDQYNVRRTLDGADSFLHVGHGSGHLLRRTFHAPTLGREKRYCIYLPPRYALEPHEHFPCLMLLPGLLDDEMTWARKTDLDDVMDRLVGEGAVPGMVVVCPDKDDTMFDEGAWDAYGAYLAEDLRQHVENEYRVIPDGTARAVEGLSLGGAWALRLAAWHPDMYRSVTGLSCAFSGDLVDALGASAPTLAARGVRFRLAFGDQEGDILAQATDTFARLLRGLGLPCEVSMDPGPHDWPLWRVQLPHSLAFHGWSFQHGR